MQNAAELVGIFAENGIESAAAFRPQDFVLVVFTYRGDAIGEEDPAFQKIEASEEFDTAQLEKSLRQISESEIEPPKASLLCQSMNR